MLIKVPQYCATLYCAIKIAIIFTATYLFPFVTLCFSPEGSSVLDRLMTLEKMMLGTPERERLKLLKTVAQSRKEIQVTEHEIFL